jgi:cell division protein FtsB
VRDPALSRPPADSHRVRPRPKRKRSFAIEIPTAAIVNRLRFFLNPKLLLIAIAAWAVYEGLISQHSVINLVKFERERDGLRQELADARAKRDDLRMKIDLIDRDEFTIEKLAREKMGLVREGEILYRYEEPPESGVEAPLTPPIVDEGGRTPGCDDQEEGAHQGP